MLIGKCEFQLSLMKKEEYCWLRLRADKCHGKCEVCKKEFSVTWGCESVIKNHIGGGKHEENIKLYQSSNKGLSSLFFCNIPKTVSSSPSVPTSNAASKSTSASCDVVITSVSGAATSTPMPSATTNSPAPSQMMMDKSVNSQALVTTAEYYMILRIIKNHDSFRSCLELGTDPKAMFPDC